METAFALFNRKIVSFHSNLNFKICKLTTFPEYYWKMVMTWKKLFPHIFQNSGCTRSQFLRYNNAIKVGNTPCHLK